MRLKKKKNNKFIIILFFVVLFFTINFNFKKIKFETSNEEFVNNVFKNSNYHFVKEEQEQDTIYDFISLVNGIDMENPVTIIDQVFNHKEEVPNILEFSYIQNTVVDNPRVYIYSTHPSEKYVDNNFSVVDASLILQEKLNSIGIQTIVEPRNADAYSKENNISNNYYATEIFIKQAISNNNYDLVIDLHRDSVPNGVSTKTTINGKDYAKVMFVTHKDCISNYEISNLINKTISNKYSTISRGIYDKRNDYYNQELYPKAILIELGSTQNTYEEVNNSIEALVDTIKEILK